MSFSHLTNPSAYVHMLFVFRPILPLRKNLLGSKRKANNNYCTVFIFVSIFFTELPATNVRRNVKICTVISCLLFFFCAIVESMSQSKMNSVIDNYWLIHIYDIMAVTGLILIPCPVDRDDTVPLNIFHSSVFFLQLHYIVALLYSCIIP